MDPMDVPPVDHGSDRYDYVEIEAPPGIRPVAQWWDDLIARPCPDCRANVFARHTANAPARLDRLGRGWLISIAHEDTCPMLALMERSADG